MNIKFAMPELLVIFSFLMYSQSFSFSIAAFCIGLLGRIMIYLIDYGIEMKKVESAQEGLKEASDVFTSIFNVNKKEV